jgi:hypothetical protein
MPFAPSPLHARLDWEDATEHTKRIGASALKNSAFKADLGLKAAVHLDVGWQRPDERPGVRTSATAFDHQEFSSVGTVRRLGTKAFHSNVGAGRNIYAFDRLAVMAGLANDLRQVAFARAGGGVPWAAASAGQNARGSARECARTCVAH